MNSKPQSTPTAPAHFASRTGKIGRLPRDIRQQLNERLADGESGQVLADWLNGCEAVRERLAEYYNGRPITEQNVSDWKLGGFRDWLRYQEARAMARECLSQADEMAEELGDDVTLTDRMSDIAAMILLKLLDEVGEMESGPRRIKAELEVLREMDRVRRSDHRQARVQILAERWEKQLDDKKELKKAEAERKLKLVKAQVRQGALKRREEYLAGMASRTLSAQSKAATEKNFAEYAAEYQELGVPGLPDKAEIAAFRKAQRAQESRRGNGAVQSDRR